jgi:CheY-like chemotaxis protein
MDGLELLSRIQKKSRAQEYAIAMLTSRQLPIITRQMKASSSRMFTEP